MGNTINKQAEMILAKSDDLGKLVNTVEPTPELIRLMYARLMELVPMGKNRVDLVTASSLDAPMALAGLKELSGVILDSGIAEAALIFGVTYRLLDNMANASDQARNDIRI